MASLPSKRTRQRLAVLFGTMGAGVAAWGAWLAVTVPGDAAAGEGWDPGFIRGTGVFMVVAGAVIVALAVFAWRRARATVA